MAEQPQYLRQYPFRHVLPYNYTYRTHAKSRWYQRPLIEILRSEFKAYTPQYYEEAIKSKRILINNQAVQCNYIVRNGDELIHHSWRQQPPILDIPIRIIHEDEQYLIVSKPPSVVVHTGGGYHFNTLMGILEFEFKKKDLYVLHRLDKLTSGLVAIAKKSQKVAIFHQGNHTMKKMYFARVGGRVRWQQILIDASIVCVSHKDATYKVAKEHSVKEIILEEDKEQFAINDKEQDKNVKEAKTVIKCIWYDEETDSSLVQCYPITGRTHQIRVHLSHLGFPILNDICYGGRFIGNPIIHRIIKEKQNEKKIVQYQEKIEQNQGQPKKRIKTNQELEGFIFPIKEEKQYQWDYKNTPWQIMLHSHKYIIQGKQYISQVPYWKEKRGILNNVMNQNAKENEQEYFQKPLIKQQIQQHVKQCIVQKTNQ